MSNFMTHWREVSDKPLLGFTCFWTPYRIIAASPFSGKITFFPKIMFFFLNTGISLKNKVHFSVFRLSFFKP